MDEQQLLQRIELLERRLDWLYLATGHGYASGPAPVAGGAIGTASPAVLDLVRQGSPRSMWVMAGVWACTYLSTVPVDMIEQTEDLIELTTFAGTCGWIRFRTCSDRCASPAACSSTGR